MFETIFWGIIALLFLALTILQCKWYRDRFSRLPQRPTIAKINGAPLDVRETVQDINNFIDHFNKKNKKANLAQIGSFLLAFCTALAAFISSLIC